MRIKQPDYRIKVENIGKWGTGGFNAPKFVNHGGQGCPKMGLIELYEDYLRCSYCGTPLSDEAAQYIMDNVPEKFMEETTPSGKKVFLWI